MADNFGAKPLLLEEDGGVKKELPGAEFGAKPIEPIDESWGRFFLRKARGLAAGAAGMPGDIEEFIRADPLSLGDMFLNEEEVKNSTPLSTAPEDRYLYSTGDIKERIDEAAKGYGYDLQPRNFSERAEDAALEFVGAGGTLGALTKGVKGARAALSLPEVVSSGAMGLAHQAGEEMDLPPLARIGLTLASGKAGHKASPQSLKSAGRGVKEAANVVKHPIKSAKKGVASLVAKAGDFKEEAYNAAKRRGIDPLLSNVIESRGLQNTESFLKESALTGPHYERKLNEISTQTKESFERILDSIAPEVKSSRSAGEGALQQLAKNIEESKGKYKDLYQKSAAAIPEGATVEFKELKKSITDLKNNLKKTALVKGQRSESLGVLNEIERNLQKEAYESLIEDRLSKITDASGKRAKPTPTQRKRIYEEARKAVERGEGKVSPETLLGTEDALNDYISWNADGGVKKSLTKVRHAAKEDIRAYAKENKEFGKLYAKADKEFSDYAKRLRSDLIQSLQKGQAPEQILSKMNNVTNVRRVEKALAQNADGREIMRSLKRAKLQEMLDGKMLNSEGVVKHQTFASALNNPKNQDMLKELLGDVNYRRVQDIRKYSSDLANASAKFANPSRSATKAFDIGVAGALASQVFKAISTGNPAIVAAALTKAGFEASIPRLLARLFTDKEFVELTAKAARNAKNPKAYKAYHDRIASRLFRVLYQQKADKESQAKS